MVLNGCLAPPRPLSSLFHFFHHHSVEIKLRRINTNRAVSSIVPNFYFHAVSRGRWEAREQPWIEIATRATFSTNGIVRRNGSEWKIDRRFRFSRETPFSAFLSPPIFSFQFCAIPLLVFLVRVQGPRLNGAKEAKEEEGKEKKEERKEEEKEDRLYSSAWSSSCTTCAFEPARRNYGSLTKRKEGEDYLFNPIRRTLIAKHLFLIRPR